jgi:sugar/nucleoside kinase (ribokinase family)
MKIDVVTIGPLNIDLLLHGQAPTAVAELQQWVGPSEVTLTAAGSSGYAALAFAKLGLRTGVVSTLADDVLGDLVLQEMFRAGVDVSHIARQPQTQSGLGIYLLLFGSQKRPLTYRYPTHVPWPTPLGESDREYLLNGRHIHCAGYLHYREMWNPDVAQLYRAARARGLTTSFDPQGMLAQYEGAWLDPVREILQYTDILLVDAHEAVHLTLSEDMRAAAVSLQQAGPRVVVIKNGAHDTLVYLPDRSFWQPAVTVPDAEIVDTVGAGDTYDAAFVAAFLSDWPLERCARFAALASASSLRGAGGIASLASRAELERLLNQAYMQRGV